jgi:hypothetical protein
MHSEKMNFPLNPQIRMMEGVVGRGNPPPSLVAPPSPGSVSKTSLGYDFAKDMGIAIVSGVTGVITFLVTKLWKYIKAKRNTPTDAAPSSVLNQHVISKTPLPPRKLKQRLKPKQGNPNQQE